MRFPLLCLAGLGVTIVSALLTDTSYAVKETHHVPPRWRRVGPAPAEGVLNLRIGFKQDRFVELEQHLFEVSDPSHARYGQHLSQAEVNDIVAPTESAVNLALEWLAEHGIKKSQIKYSSANEWIKIRLPIAQIEELLYTKYSTFEDDRGDRIFRTTEWSLPRHLHNLISTVQPTTSFMRPRQASKGKGSEDHALFSKRPPKIQPPSNGTLAELYDPDDVTPTFLRTLYGTINYTVKAADKNLMALTNYLGEVNNRSDAELYLKKFRPEAASAAYQFEQVSIDGGTLQQTPLNATQLEDGIGREGALDAQTMLGIAWPTQLVTYSTGGLNPDFIPDLFTPDDSDEPYVAWLEYMLSLPDSELPTVISTSYGDDEQTITYSYAAQACGMMAQLGARGVSLLFSSGDEGVGPDDTCYTNDGRNASSFLPNFPASCPYVTVVGATMRFNPEVAVYDDRFSSLYTSGAGFSNFFPQPAYQSKAVDNYLDQYIGGTYADLYNATGRAYPDISAQGSNFSTYWNGSVKHGSGTSASCPLTAAIITLVNDALIAAGRSPLGFLNPWLYGGGYKAFTDILSGSSAGCNTDGFPAKPGWDAVTGFGTPYLPAIFDELGLSGKHWGPWKGHHP